MRGDRKAFDMAQRFVGMKEMPGHEDNPQIMAMLMLGGSDDLAEFNSWPEHDEVPWCSAFVNYICWLERLPRSKSLMARSWLEVGEGIPLQDAYPGNDVVVLKRGKGDQPGPEVLKAPGHVGFFAGQTGALVEVLGGNQSNTVKISRYPVERVLGIRRLR